MRDSFKQFGLTAIKGDDQSFRASLTRAALSVAEPFYTAAMTVRNFCYDRGVIRTQDLGRPTISVGNITTGGTGKTPVVQWLADELRHRGHRPAILLRGYGSTTANRSDEAQLLEQSLNANQQPIIPVHVNPSRVRGAADVLRNHPQVDRFILDDGFQHRRARRDFNLVLISATQPFGFGHLLPRGLLREPLGGLARANAFLITRCSLVSAEALGQIEQYLCTHHPRIPIFHCDHQHAGVWFPSTGKQQPMESLKNQKVFLTAGIGDPASFERQIAGAGAVITGHQWFPDHHAFTSAQIESVLTKAAQSAAASVLTTEKNWVKIAPQLAGNASNLPIAVVKMQIRFHGSGSADLLKQMPAEMK